VVVVLVVVVVVVVVAVVVVVVVEQEQKKNKNKNNKKQKLAKAVQNSVDTKASGGSRHLGHSDRVRYQVKRNINKSSTDTNKQIQRAAVPGTS